MLECSRCDEGIRNADSARAPEASSAHRDRPVDGYLPEGREQVLDLRSRPSRPLKSSHRVMTEYQPRSSPISNRRAPLRWSTKTSVATRTSATVPLVAGGHRQAWTGTEVAFADELGEGPPLLAAALIQPPPLLFREVYLGSDGWHNSAVLAIGGEGRAPTVRPDRHVVRHPSTSTRWRE